MKPPTHSFFLFGPRGSGKSTWIKSVFSERMLYFDLLQSKVLLPLLKDPSLLRKQISGQSKKWIVIDEIQKCPKLLDEVHSLIEEEKSLKFVLTGSSARKLKRAEANLLAGRAHTEYFFPLSLNEVSKAKDIETILKFGALPTTVNSETDRERIRYLESYAETYLKEEIQQEALVRNLDSFLRFLEVSANLNGQVLNMTAVARETGVGRTTVNGFYSVLVDTLMGSLLPAWRPGFKIKETEHPKFYYFDIGVVRSLTNQLRDPISNEQKGQLLETTIFHELKAARQYLEVGGDFCYWATPSGGEIDFIWRRGKTIVGIEVKSGKEWKPSMGQHLKEFKKEFSATYAVYLGEQVLVDGPIQILPLKEFISRLYSGKILKPSS